MELILIIAGIVVLVIIWVISTSNRFKRMLVKINESESGVDVALVKRYDTLTKLLEVCKGYAKHELDTFSAVVNLRKGMAVEEKNAANRQMDEIAGRINLLAESYPELRSSQHFLELQKSVVEVEEHLQAARRIFNMNVSAFNQSIAVFPNSIIAGTSHYQPLAFFEAEEHKRADVEMKFS